MIEALTRDIGGCSYTLTQLNASDGYVAFHRLIRLLGPAFPQVAAIISGKEKGETLGAALKALPSVFVQSDPTEVLSLLKRLLEGSMVTIPGKTEGPVPLMQLFDLHFKGRMMAMFEVMAFAVEVNFTSFFTDAKARFGKAAAAAPVTAAP